MSRKNLLTSLTERKLTAVNTLSDAVPEDAALSPAMERNRTRGAFGAITRSIDELAERAQAAKDYEVKLLEGATVIQLDPACIDSSFIADRIGDNAQAFDELVAAIAERGQDTPILVRPHPQTSGRYMVVFGHRRVRAAKVLQRQVHAVVKDLDDTQHVIAQGQENSVRADLSFIEKAFFAFSLEQCSYPREVIMAALSVDKTVVSKMISVVKELPAELIATIGAAQESGRDRWYQLALSLRDAGPDKNWRDFIGSDEFEASTSDRRLTLLAWYLEPARVVEKKAAVPALAWSPADRSVKVALKTSPKRSVLELGAKDGSAFATYIHNQLDVLYQDFKKSQQD